jgi:uncharacterized protein
VTELDAFFLPLGQGSRFCVLHRPSNAARTRGAILYVHPFAEELNKSRRMAALQARAFAGAGWTVLQMDLLGCGDSSGDFGDATWARWIEDILSAARWLQTTTGHTPVLWGLRSGCLLIGETAQHMDRSVALVLWQPVISGKQLLQQFLRLKVASQLASHNQSERGGTQQLRTELAEGRSIEVAGYTLSPELAVPLEAAEMDLPKRPARIAWLEVGASAEEEISPAARLRIAAWQHAGHFVEAQVVSGSRFWQTVEISECPALVDATLRLADRWSE